MHRCLDGYVQLCGQVSFLKRDSDFTTANLNALMFTRYAYVVKVIAATRCFAKRESPRPAGALSTRRRCRLRPIKRNTFVNVDVRGCARSSFFIRCHFHLSSSRALRRGQRKLGIERNSFSWLRATRSMTFERPAVIGSVCATLVKTTPGII